MIEYQSFNSSEIALIKSVKKDNQILYAMLLLFYKQKLRFPGYDEDLDSTVIHKICSDLSIEYNVIGEIKISDSRSIRRFKNDIRKFLNYQKHSKESDFQFREYLTTEVFPWILNESQISRAIFEYHLCHKIESYSPQQLQQCLENSYKVFEQNFFKEIYINLNADEKKFIDHLTDFGSYTRNSETLDLDDQISLNQFKHGISGVKLKNVGDAIARYTELTKIAIPENVLDKYSRKILIKYYERVKAYYPSHINALTTQSRYALLAIFCNIRKEILADNLIELFSRLLQRIKNRSENYVKNTLVQEIKKVEGKFEILLKLTNISLDNPEGIIKNTIYPEISQELLKQLSIDLSQRSNWYKKQTRDKMCSLFSIGNRKEILNLLSLFNFEADEYSEQPLLFAIKFINSNKDFSGQHYALEDTELDSVIPEGWRDFIIDDQKKDKKIKRYNYELVVCNEVKKRLAYKGIWAKNSYRYRSPDKDLPDYITKNQQKFCDEIGLIKEESSLITSLKSSLNSALLGLNNSINNNDKVSILKGGHIKITPYVAQDVPENVSFIHQEILKRWGNINLIDAFKEANFRIGFTKRFISIGKYSHISDDNLTIRLLLSLYAIGSNTGLKRISAANSITNESDLKYIKLRFINATNVRHAIIDVVNEVIKIRDPKIWGEETTSVACDSKKIAAWDQNLLTQWHPRYKGNGIMVYWHVDTNSLCVYSQSKNCLSSEVASMMKGVLEHSTEMDLDTAYIDTHGQSTIGVGVGVGRLLNFNVFPRLKNISSQKLYIASNSDKSKLSNLSKIIKASIKWKNIEDGYKDSIPYIIALKKGLLEPEVFVKRFSKDNYNHPVYKALCEIGKVEKTIFLCRYLSDEKFRIKINAALNIVERLNSVMNFFFYGKISGLNSNDPDEQELSILCLHLLQVCAVYINTLLIQEIFSSFSLHNKFQEADYRALSPLICSHFNPYGIFILNLKDRLIINKQRVA